MLYCCHVCPQPLQIQPIFRKLPHKQKHCWYDIRFLFSLCSGELRVMFKHLVGLLRPDSQQSCSSPNIKCTPIHESYNTPPTDSVRHISYNYPRWFTLLDIESESLALPHPVTSLSDSGVSCLMQMATIKFLCVYGHQSHSSLWVNHVMPVTVQNSC